MSNHSKKPPRVGYKSPPEEHRFRKGQSGNSRGRPPKRVRAILPRQLRRDIIALCETETRIRTAEGERKVSIVEAVLLRLAQKALAGHGPSMRRLIDHYGQAVKEHFEEHEQNFSFIEMVERDDIERPAPPENERFNQKRINDLRKKTRRY